ncbi:MAG: hypothetical protein ABIT37_10600 [Luteolibacter sp.]
MFQKICLGVCAASTFVTALFCVLIMVSLFRANQEFEKMFGGLLSYQPNGGASGGQAPATEAEMAKERAEIERQLDQRAKTHH